MRRNDIPSSGNCGSGMLAGAMTIVGVTFGGYWKRLPPEEFLRWVSENGYRMG